MIDPADTFLLRLAGYADEHIRDMSDEERAAEVEQALEQNVLAPRDADCVLPRRPFDVKEWGTGDRYMDTVAMLRRMTWRNRQWIWSLVFLALGILIGLML